MFSDPLYNWALYVGVGMVLLLTMLAIALFSERAKLFIGRYLRPCWITVLGLLMGWFGYFYCYRAEEYFLTIIFMVLSGGLDLIDGPVGRAKDKVSGKREINGFWPQFNHWGTTKLGKDLDPLVDKLVTGTIFGHMATLILLSIWHGMHDRTAYQYLAAIQLLLVVIVDIGGQLTRMDCFKSWRVSEDTGATLIGKIKSPVQRIWMLFFPVWHHAWVTELETYLLFINFLLAIVLGLTIMSAASKIRLTRRPRVNDFVQE